MKNIILLSAADVTEVFTPLLWASSKSYYELRGQRPEEYNWVLPHGDYLSTVEEIKDWIKDNPPSVFGISLYMWNFHKAMAVASWVKDTYPNCIVISGGQQQYFKHDSDWFKNNSWLDACLPGDEYGERTIADLLDNLTEDNTIDWNRVNGVVYPNKSRDMLLRSPKAERKNEFFWNYSPYAMQFDLIKQWAEARAEYSVRVQGKLEHPLVKIETTRGCPYGCTYCDWGGGTNSKVIAKDLAIVEQDIEAISRLQLSFCYICDANSGILGQRDVDVIELFAKYKKLNGWPWTVHVGGLAKTPKAKDTIIRMLSVLADNELDKFKAYKIAIQTLDPVTQKNIDRTDIPIEIYAEIAEYMKSRYGYRPHAEVILGLPGQTIDNFYHELQEFARYDFTPQFYPWALLPESVGYDAEYREKFKIGTVTKSDVTASPYYGKVSKFVQENKQKNLQYTDLVLVCSTYSYTKEEYAEMTIMAGLYTSLYYTGILKYFVNNNVDISATMKRIWALRNSNNIFGYYLRKSLENYLKWLDTPQGNIFYLEPINENDKYLYSLEEFWAQLVFFEPEQSRIYLELASQCDLLIFDNLININNYPTVDNKFWKYNRQTAVEAFNKIIETVRIFFKPDDAFIYNT